MNDHGRMWQKFAEVSGMVGLADSYLEPVGECLEPRKFASAARVKLGFFLPFTRGDRLPIKN
jgi:hypothetical protein